MSIITTVYNALSTNGVLDGLLARHKLAPSKPAIYEAWAAEDTAKPYLCLTYFNNVSNHWAKRKATITVDIFTEGNTVQAEAIRNRVIKILDRHVIYDEEDREIRCYLDNDQIIDEDNERITHWNIEFSAMLWRNEFVDYLNEEFQL